MAKEWIIAPPWPARQEAAARFGTSPLVAQLLHNRGIDEPDAARRFLRPQLTDLHPPEQMPGATQAADLLADALRDNHRIIIYGDYDVDGITATAILWHTLKRLGADVDFYVPHRLEEGYGLNADAVAKLAADGAQTIVSVDCGITAVEVAQLARQRNVRLIITDHHSPGAVLPEADAIVHPAIGEGNPNTDSCGAGVAFKLAWALAQRVCGAERVSPELREVLVEGVGLVALGTIADVVPLLGENRIFARHGLAGLAASKLPGVRALIEHAKLNETKLDSFHVGFVLAPRLNAAGRMGHARLAVELLTRATPERAREIAIYLDSQNRNRQTLERRITKQACEMVTAAGMDRDGCRGIVLAHEEWHAGVIGIVASRLVDRFGCPTVLIAMENGFGQGSGRSVEHFNLFEALCNCREHLDTFGGHAMAAGLRIAAGRVDAFAEAFVARANQTLTAADLRPTLPLDAEATLAELTEPLVQALLDLGPFGFGNPTLRLATGWCELIGSPRKVGRDGDHLQFTVRQDGCVRKAIAFRQANAAQPLLDARRCRLAFEPILNEFNGRRSVELQVLDIQFPID
ncbi:MAG: single-stranded-DNA-specific exonuclease RecJ [Phycisphaerae bacterium]|nr:single-stranded-DNA-specific exonuclease RecJ [Phycisphaerae bacterium]